MKDPIVQVETPAGAKILRHKAEAVLKKEFGGRALTALVAKMKKALAKEEYGVAIAAPQAGSSVRLFVVAGRVFEDEEKPKRATHQALPQKSSGRPSGFQTFASEPAAAQDRVFINPELIRLSRKKKEMSEGCLSVRGKYGSVLRHERASVRAQDEEGKVFTYNGAGLLAQIFQHEVEHLEGILFIDRAERLWQDPEMASPE